MHPPASPERAAMTSYPRLWGYIGSLCVLCFPTGGFAGTNESFALRKTTRSAAKTQGSARKGCLWQERVKRWAQELATETKQPSTSQKTRLEERNLGKCLRKPGAPKPPGAWGMPHARWHRAGKAIRRGAPRQAPFLQKNLPRHPFCFPQDYFFSQREPSCLSCYFYEMLFSLRGQQGKLEPPVARAGAEQPPAGSCTVGFPSAPGERGLSSPNPPRAKAHFSSPQFASPVKN